MSVLYEDLRIETSAIHLSSKKLDQLELERLDDLSIRYRIHYFLRRSVATLLEIRGALLQLMLLPEYGAEEVAAQEDAQRKFCFERLSRARNFFEHNLAAIKSLRNNVGGHFQHEAAEFAVRNIQNDAIGQLEISTRPFDEGGGPKLHFAGEVAALAFTKSLPAIKTRERESDDLISLITDGYAHATLAMYELVMLFLWSRFGRQ
jgi:hypothetical protein